jgi:ADP-ribose pyrophosphatase YjhB (NUDIX family)
MAASDTPIGIRADGTPIYDNTPTVVVVAIMITDGPRGPTVLTIKRATNPCKGMWALPGGYHMRGESWQECGAREVLEEIGVRIDPTLITPLSLVTDIYGNNVITSKYVGETSHFPTELSLNPLEVSDVAAMTISDIERTIGFWGFPVHVQAALDTLE